MAWPEFQSPYGDFGTPAEDMEHDMELIEELVSVPLRGFWYAGSVFQYPLPDWAHRRFFQTSGFFRLFG